MDQAEAIRGGRVTVRDFRAMRQRGEQIAMVTAYDFPTARAAEEAGIPAILVGDSLGPTVLGFETTVRVTMADILHHTQAVTRAVRRAMVVADLPFMSYQPGPETAVINAGRLLQEGGATAVKLEGGQAVAATVRRIVEAGIPLMGHLGLTPQSVHRFGGYHVQARTSADAQRLLTDARALEDAGAFALVLELVPGWLAEEVTAAVTIPTIGIGAGPACSGQVQVLADLIGLDTAFVPRHARVYAPLGEEMRRAIRAYVRDVQTGQFPLADHYRAGHRPAGFPRRPAAEAEPVSAEERGMPS